MRPLHRPDARLGVALLLAGSVSLAATSAAVTVTGGGYFSQLHQGSRVIGLTVGVTVTHHAPGPVRVALTLAERRVGCTAATKPTITLTAGDTASRAGVATVYLRANAAQLAPLKTEGRLCVVAVHVDSQLLPRPAAGWDLLPALPGQD